MVPGRLDLLTLLSPILRHLHVFVFIFPLNLTKNLPELGPRVFLLRLFTFPFPFPFPFVIQLSLPPGIGNSI